MTEPQQSFHIAPIIFGAVIGAISSSFAGFLLRIWQYERDNWLKRVDWFCDTLEQAADIGTEYWCERGSENAKDGVRAHRILGLQTRLDGLLATLSERFAHEDSEIVSSLMGKVRDALSGGSFMSGEEKPDLNRAREVQASVSDLVIAVRKASDAAVSPSKVFTDLIPRRRYPSSEEDWR